MLREGRGHVGWDDVAFTTRCAMPASSAGPILTGYGVAVEFSELLEGGYTSSGYSSARRTGDKELKEGSLDRYDSSRPAAACHACGLLLYRFGRLQSIAW